MNELPPVVSTFDMIAALSHKTFNERVLQVPEYMGGRKVLAALVMKKGGSECRGTVICLGTGNTFSLIIIITNTSVQKSVSKNNTFIFVFLQAIDASLGKV